MKMTSWPDWIWRGLCFCFGLFWLGLLVRWQLLTQLFVPEGNGDFWPLLGLYTLVWLAYGLVAWRLLWPQERHWQVALGILLLAALPRVLLFWQAGDFYQPTSDFARYLAYAQHFVQGDYEAIAQVVANYQMPKMAGLAVFNGILGLLFTPTLAGMQVSNILMTSLICVVIYVLLVPYHKGGAILAALLFALYPANLISCLIPTNHHGATLFFLLAVLTFQHTLQARHIKGFIGFLLLTIILLTISDFIHQSVIVIQLSMLCCTFFLLLPHPQRPQGQNRPRILLATVAMFLGVALCSTLSLQVMERAGLLLPEQTAISPLFKVVLGLNAESGGTWNRPDYETFIQLSGEAQSQKCKEIIQERLQDLPAVAALMIDKVGRTWFTTDNIFHFYSETYEQTYQQKGAQNQLTEADRAQYQTITEAKAGLCRLDTFFLQIVYVLLLIGLWQLSGKYPGGTLGILFFIPLGWTAVIMLTEMQGRYRYPAMIPIFCIAALGCARLGQWWHARKRSQTTQKIR